MHWRRHWAYLQYVLRHKWFVFRACLEYGLIWRGLIHDWTKFLPSEWLPYARTFYAPDGSKQYKPDADFNRAWNHHQKANSHHWQYYVLHEDSGGLVVIEMSAADRNEMLADWRGAGLAQGKPNTWEWYEANKDKIMLHPDTREYVEWELTRFKMWQQNRQLISRMK